MYSWRPSCFVCGPFDRQSRSMWNQINLKIRRKGGSTKKSLSVQEFSFMRADPPLWRTLQGTCRLTPLRHRHRDSSTLCLYSLSLLSVSTLTLSLLSLSLLSVSTLTLSLLSLSLLSDSTLSVSTLSVSLFLYSLSLSLSLLSLALSLYSLSTLCPYSLSLSLSLYSVSTFSVSTSLFLMQWNHSKFKCSCNENESFIYKFNLSVFDKLTSFSHRFSL